MSSNKKAEGTTSRLLQAADEVLKPNSNHYIQIVERLEADHTKAAEAAIPPEHKEIRNRLMGELRQEFQKLASFLQAAEVNFPFSRSCSIVINYFILITVDVLLIFCFEICAS